MEPVGVCDWIRDAQRLKEFQVIGWQDVREKVLRLFGWAFRGRRERALEDELAFHLAMKRAKYSGEGQDDATVRAKSDFGSVEKWKDECRDAGSFRWIDSACRDAKHSFRLFARNPGFVTIAIAALAFGIGANTALFSVVQSVLLRPLPYQHPQNLYSIEEYFQQGAKRSDMMAVNSGNFLLWASHVKAFSAMALVMPEDDNLILHDGAVQIHGARTTARLFSMLGVQPAMGRFFPPKADVMGNGLYIVLTHALWERQFHSDPAIIGKKISLNGYPIVVTAVLPRDFYFPKQNQLFSTPVAGSTHSIGYFLNANLQPYEQEPCACMLNFAVIGRLWPGVSPKQATAQLNALEATVPQGGEPPAELRAHLTPLKTFVIGGNDRSLWIAMGGAVLVLFLVCINLAGLLLAKSFGRTHEIAVRKTLGATRVDLFRQFAIEGLMLTITGGALGLLAANVIVRAFVVAAPVDIPRLQSVTVDRNVLLFSLLATAATGLLISLVPALRLVPKEAAGALKRRPVSRMQQALTIAEFALCTVLLITAMLIGRSFLRVMSANRGMNQARVLTFDVTPPLDHYNDNTKRKELFKRLVQQVDAYPGVESAGIVSALPLTGAKWGQEFHFVESPEAMGQHPNSSFRFASPGYFQALHLPLLAGRYLKDSDAGRHVVLISELVAKQLPPGENAVGEHVRWYCPGGKGETISEIAGVVADVRSEADQQASFMLYVPYWEYPPWNVSLLVRTHANASGIAHGIQKMIRHLDREIAIPPAKNMQQVLNEAVASRRLLTLLGMLFAGSATLLAALGLYGLVALTVSLRTREIGIRIAVGAQRQQIFGLLMTHSLRLALAGVMIGLLCALVADRSLTALLYEVKPEDPATFLLVCGLLLLVGLLAGCGPARRAMQVDPLTALKWE